jgi:hypothetical protein
MCLDVLVVLLQGIEPELSQSPLNLSIPSPTPAGKALIQTTSILLWPIRALQHDPGELPHLRDPFFLWLLL